MIPLSELRRTLISEATVPGRKPVYSHYDEHVDTMTVLLAPAQGDTFVYYIDGDIALVCEVDTLKVLGFQIEAFAKKFLPKQANQDLARTHAIWRLPEFA